MLVLYQRRQITNKERQIKFKCNEKQFNNKVAKGDEEEAASEWVGWDGFATLDRVIEEETSGRMTSVKEGPRFCGGQTEGKPAGLSFFSVWQQEDQSQPLHRHHLPKKSWCP